MAKKVERIPTKISPDILDTIGKSFKFNHGKGVAEWLKNSLDHYLRLYELEEEQLSGQWPVFINLIDSKGQSKGPNIALIDFGGTTFENIRDFFLHWGDTSAARFGGVAITADVTGGHGNGGKFYMREMWRGGSRFLTWKNGKVTSLVVDKVPDGTTGVWEMKNEEAGWKDALRAALHESEHLHGADWVMEYLSENGGEIYSELEEGIRGFSVIVGMKAVQIYSSNDVVKGGKWDHQELIDDIRNAAQARRPIKELSISIFINGDLRLERLSPEEIEEDNEWEVFETKLPLEIIKDTELAEGAEEVGSLSLHLASRPLVGRQSHLNNIQVVDEKENPIAFYKINELPLAGHSNLSSFLFGELQLKFPRVSNIVENERVKLVTCATTDALLEWVASQIWQRIKAVEETRRQKEKDRQLNLSKMLNDELNKHAQRFLRAIQAEILVDFIEDPEGGGLGDEGTGVAPVGSGSGGGSNGKGTGGNGGGGGTLTVEGKSNTKRRPKFPEVLLSGFDPNPADSEYLTKVLNERYPPLWQDDIDAQHNVWWINTTHPFAKEALKHGGAQGAAFKSYQLFMFVEVVQHETLRYLHRRQAELALDIVENELNDIANRFLADIPHDLADRLLVSKTEP